MHPAGSEPALHLFSRLEPSPVTVPFWRREAPARIEGCRVDRLFPASLCTSLSNTLRTYFLLQLQKKKVLKMHHNSDFQL